MSVANGETQVTSQQRIDAWKKGWQPGQADLVLHNHHATYNGLAARLKEPLGSGLLSEAQAKMLKSYKLNNFLGNRIGYI